MAENKEKETNEVPEQKTETPSLAQEVKNSQKNSELRKKPKLPKLKLNFVGMLYLTNLRSKNLGPLEKIVLAYITGLILDESLPEEKRSKFTGFNEAHFKYYSDKYKNNLLKKIRVPLFKKISESLQSKKELTLTFDFLGRANAVLNKRHSTGCCLPIFEIDPSKRISIDKTYLTIEDNLEGEVGYNKNADYNYTAWIILSGLLKCANQSLVECEGFYVNRIQIIKLASTLLQMPEAVINDAMNYLFKIGAVFTKESLVDPSKEFSLYDIVKTETAPFEYLYINESIVSSYMNWFPNFEILHYSFEISRTSSVFSGKYR